MEGVYSEKAANYNRKMQMLKKGEVSIDVDGTGTLTAVKIKARQESVNIPGFIKKLGNGCINTSNEIIKLTIQEGVSEIDSQFVASGYISELHIAGNEAPAGTAELIKHIAEANTDTIRMIKFDSGISSDELKQFISAAAGVVKIDVYEPSEKQKKLLDAAVEKEEAKTEAVKKTEAAVKKENTTAVKKEQEAKKEKTEAVKKEQEAKKEKTEAAVKKENTTTVKKEQEAKKEKTEAAVKKEQEAKKEKTEAAVKKEQEAKKEKTEAAVKKEPEAKKEKTDAVTENVEQKSEYEKRKDAEYEKLQRALDKDMGSSEKPKEAKAKEQKGQQKEPEKLTMIAYHTSAKYKGALIGLRLIGSKVHDYTIKELVEMINSNTLNVTNLRVQLSSSGKGIKVGEEALKYTHIQSGKVIGSAPIVIEELDSDGQYHVVSYMGKRMTMTFERLKEYAAVQGIANGSIEDAGVSGEFNRQEARDDVKAGNMTRTKLALVGDDRIAVNEDGSVVIDRDKFQNEASIKVPSGVTKLARFSFSHFKAEAIELPSSLREIGESCFEDCSNLKSIEIPDGVTVIKTGTFMKCRKLSKVILPGTVKEIEELAFNGCTHLKQITAYNPNISVAYNAVPRGCRVVKKRKAVV